MQLLIVIHHPETPIRPAKELLAEVAGEYDRIMGATSRRHYHELTKVLILHLDWPRVHLGWPAWSTDPAGEGLLATVGMPLLDAPPDRRAEMLHPSRLKSLIDAGGADPSAELGWCGGAFAAAHVATAGRVRLVTNYLGEVPLYRAEGRDGLTVWSNKAAAAVMLAGIEPRLDEQAARQFILLAHPLGNRSLYAGVEVEPPAMCVTIDSANVRRKPYLDLPRAMFEHRLPREEIVRRTTTAMEPLITHLRESRPNVCVHLSGGMDSRAVLALCARHGFRVHTRTHSAPNDEVPVARRLARRLRVPYKVVQGHPEDEGSFFADIRACMWQSDGLASLKYLAGRYDLAMVRDDRYIPLEGLGGESGRGYYFGGGAEAMSALEGGDFSGFLDKALGQRASLWPRPEEVQALRGELTGILDSYRQAGLDSFAATTYFYVHQRVRRWGTARRNTGWQWMIDPLLMPCWTYCAMSAAPADQADDRLIAALIDHAAPGLRGVATAKELAAAARRRRVAGNRITRLAMAAYDRLRGPAAMPVQTEQLDKLRAELISHIRPAESLLPSGITAGHADHWLERRPWRYDQTELFWHTATLASWCSQFVMQPPAIGAAATDEYGST